MCVRLGRGSNNNKARRIHFDLYKIIKNNSEVMIEKSEYKKYRENKGGDIFTVRGTLLRSGGPIQRALLTELTGLVLTVVYIQGS